MFGPGVKKWFDQEHLVNQHGSKQLLASYTDVNKPGERHGNTPVEVSSFQTVDIYVPCNNNLILSFQGGKYLRHPAKIQMTLKVDTTLCLRCRI